MKLTSRKITSVVFLLCLALSGSLGCQTTGKADEKMGDGDSETTPMVVATGEVNSLSAEEQAAGWHLLFDGENLDQWRGFKRDSLPKGWQAANEALYFDGDGEGDLITKEQFRNFDLKLEWKISPAGNSGIMFRSDEKHETSYQTGPEMQILDDAAHPDAGNGPTRMAGANYDMHAPAKNVVRPAGAWNEVRILANGSHIEHWMNGEKIVDYDLWIDEWKQMVAGSKWKDYPDYGMNETGHIVLQDHGDPVWFRNIKIRRLPDSTEAPK